MTKTYLKICININFIYSTKRQECLCGDTYGKYGSAPETDCKSACNGDSSQICGAGDRNSIYKIKDTYSKYLRQFF